VCKLSVAFFLMKASNNSTVVEQFTGPILTVVDGNGRAKIKF